MSNALRIHLEMDDQTDQDRGTIKAAIEFNFALEAINPVEAVLAAIRPAVVDLIEQATR